MANKKNNFYTVCVHCRDYVQHRDSTIELIVYFDLEKALKDCLSEEIFNGYDPDSIFIMKNGEDTIFERSFCGEELYIDPCTDPEELKIIVDFCDKNF